MKLYAIETRFIPAWENCRTENNQPFTFAGKANAEADLNQYLEDLAESEGMIRRDPPRNHATNV